MKPPRPTQRQSSLLQLLGMQGSDAEQFLICPMQPEDVGRLLVLAIGKMFTNLVNPDWAATEGYGAIKNKPALGTAAAQDSAAFDPAGAAATAQASAIYTAAGDASNKADSAQAYATQRVNHTGTQAWGTITGAPTSLAGYGITDPVVTTGGSYANPAWITGLAWAKVTGTPTTLGGYGINDAQPLDSDLTAIALLSTSSFGRAFLALADAGAARTYIGAGVGAGSVTSVGLTMPTGFSVSGAPITGAGTLGVTTALSGIVQAAAGEFSAITIGSGLTYTGGALSVTSATYQPLDADLTALAAISATGSFYYRSAADTWMPVTITAPIAFSAGAVSLTPVGSAGTYSQVTTDASGRVTAGQIRAISAITAPALVTTAAAANGTQISTTRDAFVTCEVTTSVTATIGGAASATVVLEICPTNSAVAANWVEIDKVANGQTITLAIALQSIQTLSFSLRGHVPAGYFYRLRQTLVGTTSASSGAGQQMLY